MNEGISQPNTVSSESFCEFHHKYLQIKHWLQYWDGRGQVQSFDLPMLFLFHKCKCVSLLINSLVICEVLILVVSRSASCWGKVPPCLSSWVDLDVVFSSCLILYWFALRGSFQHSLPALSPQTVSSGVFFCFLTQQLSVYVYVLPPPFPQISPLFLAFQH